MPNQSIRWYISTPTISVFELQYPYEILCESLTY